MPRVMTLARVGLGLAMTALLAMSVSACTSKKVAPCNATSSRTLRIAIADVRGRAAKFQGLPFIYWTNPSLVWVDQRGKPVPGLAQSWRKTDPRTWTFTLQPDLRTHNGQPFTADRVRAAILARMQRFPTFPVVRDLDAIDAPTPTTLVFRFKQPVNELPEMFVHIGIANELESPELSAGPWRIVRQTREQVELVAFPSDPPAGRGSVTPNRLQVSMYPDMRAAWAAFLRNEVDFLHEVPLAAVPSLSQNQDIRLYVSAAAQAFAFGFHRRAPALRDVRVRQAINLAIDREDIVRRLYGGYPPLLRYAKAVAGPFSPEYWAMEGNAALWPYDPAKARALLKAATGGRGDTLEISCLTSKEFPEIAEIAAIVEAQLQRAHIRLRLEPLPYNTLLARLEHGDFDSYVLPMRTAFTGLWAYNFWHSDFDSGFRDGRMGYNGADEPLERLFGAASPEAERAAVRDVMDAMHRDPPAAFLVTNPIVRGVRSTWRVPEDDFDIRRSVHRWKLDRPCGTS